MYIDRGKRALKDDAVLNVGEARGALELIKDHLAIGREHSGPVMPWPQKWGVHQNIKRIAAWRCSRRIGNRSGREIAGWIRRRRGEVVNVVNLFLRIAGENKVMVGQMLVAFL